MKRTIFCAHAVLLSALFQAPTLHSQETPKVSSTASPVLSPAASAKPATPSADSSPLAQARQFYRAGKFAAASEQYSSIIKSGVDAGPAYAGLARVYLKQGKISDAYASAQKAVEAAPQLATTHVALAEVYFRQGKFPETEHELLPLMNLASPDPRAMLVLSRVYRAASYNARAKMLIDRAHALDPADPDIGRRWMATLDVQERLKALESYLSNETNDDEKERGYLKQEVQDLKNLTNQPSRSCHLTTKIASTQAKLEGLMRDEKHLRGYGLKVAINGVGSKLLLDTGAGGILITKQIADKAGVKRLVQTEFGGIGNERAAEGYIGYADSIKIGELEFQNCYVDVVEKGSRVGGDGLIGADVFSHFLIDLNLVDAKFSLSPLPPLPGEQPNEATLDSRGLESPHFHDRYIAPEMKSYTPVYRFGHMLLMQTHLNEGPPKLFLIDTGGFDNQISPDAAKEVTKVHSDASFTISGLNGEVKHVMRADDVTLQFAHLKQTRHDMFSIDLSDISNSEGTEISGILGFAMLYLTDIRIDYRDGLVDMAFDPKRWQ